MHVGVKATCPVKKSKRTGAADDYTDANISGVHAPGRPDLRRLALGSPADITIVGHDGPHLGQFLDPIQTLVLSGSGRDVKTVIVMGESSSVTARFMASTPLQCAFRRGGNT